MEPRSGPEPAQRVADLLAATEAYDIRACERLFAAAIADLDTLTLVRDVVAPVLREAGNRWHRGQLAIVQEHMLSNVVRRQLSNLLESHLARADGPTLLFTTLSGERHEMGGLMGAVLAASRGFHCIYLGPSLPVEEICRFCAHRPVRAVALSVVTQPDVIDVPTQLRELRGSLPPDVDVWVAGQAAVLLSRAELPSGIVAIDTLEAFLHRLARLRARN